MKLTNFLSLIEKKRPLLASPGEPKSWQIFRTARRGKTGLFPKLTGRQTGTVRDLVSTENTSEGAIAPARRSS